MLVMGDCFSHDTRRRGLAINLYRTHRYSTATQAIDGDIAKP